MKTLIQTPKTIAPVRDSLKRSSWRRGILLIALVLASFPVSPTARAFCQDGCPGNFNTYLGENALLDTSGSFNTAIGFAALFFNSTGSDNTAVGSEALVFSDGSSNTAVGAHALRQVQGDNNTATGSDAMFGYNQEIGVYYNNTADGANALYSIDIGSDNTAEGAYALFNNTTANKNTATGYTALFSNTTGDSNTADGYAALYGNTTGGYNTASGYATLYGNTTGGDNTANGYAALYSNTTGSDNTAVGFKTLFGNSTGSNNVANGFQALYSNTTGFWNTGNGVQALYSNTTGIGNTADGLNALYKNTTGGSNTAIGMSALTNNTTGSYNTAEGLNALGSNTTGSDNIALGDSAGFNLTTGSFNIDIGNKGVAGEHHTIRIGKKGTQTATFIAGISGTTVAGGVGVLIDSNGRLGTINSSARFKDEIKPMDKASEAILALQPVTFRYKHELDPDGIPQFGLVAEQVAKVNPDLVVRDDDGKPYTVRYEAVNAMLLNEFLKEHRKVEELQATVAQQQSANTEQQKEIKALAQALKEQEAQIQKVSAQLATGRARPTDGLAANKLALPPVAGNQ